MASPTTASRNQLLLSSVLEVLAEIVINNYRTEVTSIIITHAFVGWLSSNSPNEYKEMLVDSSVWEQNANGIAYGAPMMKHYSKHPAYHFYPVVGVNQKQAKVMSLAK